MEELWDVVDEFIVVEARQTFSGKPKPVHLDMSRLSRYNEKVKHAVIDIPDTVKNPWARETHQRNAIWNYISHYDDGVLVLLSDVDEIPAVEAVEEVMLRDLYDHVVGFEQQMSYYYVNMVSSFQWIGTRAVKKGCIAHDFNGSMQEVRGTFDYYIPKAGWHLSYLGGIEQVQEKIGAFSHTELNRPEFTSEDHIHRVMESGKDLFGRDILFSKVPLDGSMSRPFPRHIVEKQTAYRSFIA
jgi:hypothetical protein